MAVSASPDLRCAFTHRQLSQAHRAHNGRAEETHRRTSHAPAFQYFAHEPSSMITGGCARRRPARLARICSPRHGGCKAVVPWPRHISVGGNIYKHAAPVRRISRRPMRLASCDSGRSVMSKPDLPRHSRRMRIRAGYTCLHARMQGPGDPHPIW